MTIADYIIIAAVAILAAIVLYLIVKKKWGMGCSGCSGNCFECQKRCQSGPSACSNEPEKNKNKKL